MLLSTEEKFFENHLFMCVLTYLFIYAKFYPGRINRKRTENGHSQGVGHNAMERKEMAARFLWIYFCTVLTF